MLNGNIVYGEFVSLNCVLSDRYDVTYCVQGFVSLNCVLSDGYDVT
jgi:hypothetical protein